MRQFNERKALQMLRERKERLDRARFTTRFVSKLTALGIVSAFIALFGYVSTGDYYIETGYVPTAAEIIGQNRLLIAGCVLFGVCAVLLFFCDRINAAIDSQLEHVRMRREQCIRLRNERMEREARESDEMARSAEITSIEEYIEKRRAL